MKDTSRPHPTPSSRAAPYRKYKSSGNLSPLRGTRRAHDASQPLPPSQTREGITPSDRPSNSRRDEAQLSRAALDSPTDDEHRSFSKTGGYRAVSHVRRHTTTDGPMRNRPPHTSPLSIRAEVPGPSLRLPLTSAPPTRKVESPPPGSVTAFLRSIELPDNPSSAPPLQTSFSVIPPSPCRPPLSADNASRAPRTNENGNGYQVSLVYKGYPFTYDLSALPDDPKGTIALLNITKSDPGAYFLVGAHYRRTARSRAACAVMKALLDTLDTPSDIDKGKEEAIPVPTSATSTVTLVAPGSPCHKETDWKRPVFKSAAMRPAMLLLAACELDISREYPDDPESAGHAAAAHDLFRAVYGTVNDAIIAGAVRPRPENALGLEFSSNNCVSSSLSDSNNKPKSTPLEVASQARIKELELELDATRAAQKELQEKLAASNDRLMQAEGQVHALESQSQTVLVRLDASQDENWELRQRLAESEQRARELSQCTPSESRVWGRLKDLLFDGLGGSMRGE